MATNLALDDKLIEEVKQIGGFHTKREAVNAALAEYVRREKKKHLLSLMGTVAFDPSYNYKAERNRKRR